MYNGANSALNQHGPTHSEHIMNVPVGNAAWVAKIDAVLSNPTLDDEARRQGVCDVLVELTQRPLYVIYHYGYYSIYDFSKFVDHTHPIYTFYTDVKNMRGQKLLSTVSTSYQDYIWSIYNKTYDTDQIKHFEEHDLSLFKRLDDLKFWFPIELGSNPSKSWEEYIKSQQPKPTAPPVPTVKRNSSVSAQGQSSNGLIVLNLSLFLLMCVGVLAGAASIFGTPAVLITMFCVVFVLIMLNEKSTI